MKLVTAILTFSRKTEKQTWYSESEKPPFLSQIFDEKNYEFYRIRFGLDLFQCFCGTRFNTF